MWGLYFVDMILAEFDAGHLEIVMNELRKNQKFHFDLQIPPTLPNGTTA